MEIKHSEIPLQFTSQEIWESKYQLKDEHQKPVDHSVEDSYKRIAKALAAIEHTDQEYWESEFLWALKNGATPAGRIVSNAGAEKYKPATSLINCTVSQIVEDSMQGVLDSNLQAGLTLKAGCGIGYEFSTLRPKGAFVNGAGAYTSGPLTFMDIFDKMCFTVSSAGGRRGAQMATFAVWHPDVEEFIQAKREDGRLRQFNCSLLVDDEFFEAVKSGGTYKLVFPIKQSEIDKGLVDESTETVYKKRFWEKDYCQGMGYTLNENDELLCKVYKEINAEDLWDTIMKSTYDYAEPGILLIDRINQYNNNWFCEEIRATNPCQPAWAKVLTKEGIRTFGDISVGDEIWSKEGWTKVLNKWSNGVKPVYKYETASGVFYGTENHRVVSASVKIEAKDAESVDIITGPVSETVINPSDVMDGLVIGDGSVHNASNNLVFLCIGENDGDYFESEVAPLITCHRPGIRDYAYEVSSFVGSEELPLTYNRRIPTRYMESPDRVVGFLRGLFSANGSVVNNRITLKSASKGLVEDVQMMLNSVGIRSYCTTNRPKTTTFSNGDYLCKESYDINISTDRQKFCEMIGFIQNYKNDKVTYVRSSRVKSTYDIKEVGFVSEEEVYDITVDNESHTYWTQGCDVSNCGEQPLPPEGSCLLGSVNVAMMVDKPFTAQATFDWDKYCKVIRIFTRMLDNVVEINGLPLEGQQAEIISKRRHGMGFLGLGSSLSLLGKEYGDEWSVDFTENLMRVMAVEGFREGVELAQEKGAAPIFFEYTEGRSNRDLWCEGEYMKRIWEVAPELCQKAREHGCRFTHHTSIAPTGTISLSLNNNVSNGIEPSFSHKYTRNVIRAGKKSKEAVNVYSYEMLLYKEVTGEDEVPEFFSTSENVGTYAHVDIQAAAQKWCDSSISKTINVPTETGFEEFQDIYMYAYDSGLKGCTTFRFNPEAFQGVLVTEENLEKTTYNFVTEDGDKFALKGNEKVMYDGEEHTAANLYDALKEGYFGKF